MKDQDNKTNWHLVVFLIVSYPIWLVFIGFEKIFGRK